MNHHRHYAKTIACQLHEVEQPQTFGIGAGLFLFRTAQLPLIVSGPVRPGLLLLSTRTNCIVVPLPVYFWKTNPFPVNGSVLANVANALPVDVVC